MIPGIEPDGESNLPTVEQLFSHSLCLSVDDAHYALFARRFDRIFGMHPRRFDGYRLEGLCGRTNIMLGHTAIVKAAKALGWPYVIVFEDDALPRDDAAEMLPKAVAALPDEATLAFLGWVVPVLVDRKVVNDLVARAWGRFSGAHAWLITAAGYDEFLAKTVRINADVDMSAGFIKHTCYLLRPLFIQASGYDSTNWHGGYSGDGRCNMARPPEGFSADQEVDEYLRRKGRL